jgi:hypothetical protein
MFEHEVNEKGERLLGVEPRIFLVGSTLLPDALPLKLNSVLIQAAGSL